MNVAIIPARSGSKRIKNKNTKIFIDEPIILKTLEKIFKSNIFKKIIVSSDSKKILNLCKKNIMFFNIKDHQNILKMMPILFQQ